MLSTALAILCAFAAGAGIALLGNHVGRRSGRNKLVVFGLRPRHTANVVTGFTGGCIAVVTLLISLSLSGQMEVLQGGIQRLQAEYDRLREAYEELRQSGRVAFQGGEALAVAVVEPGLPAGQVERIVASALATAEATARQRYYAFQARLGESPAEGEGPRLTYADGPYRNLLALLTGATTAQAVEVRVAQNVWVEGGGVRSVPVLLSARPVGLVYPRGAEIARATFDPDDPDLLTKLNEFVHTTVPAAAREEGMPPDPVTGTLDVSVGAAPMADWTDWTAPLLRALQGHRGPVEIEARAAQDLYSVGRVDLVLDSPGLDLGASP